MGKNDSNQDATIRSVATILLGLLVFALIYNVFFGAGIIPGVGNAGMHQTEMMGMVSGGTGTLAAGVGFNLSSLLAGILALLIKLLSWILVIGLIVGIWIVVRDYLFVDGDNPFTAISNNLAGMRKSCPQCGSKVNPNWTYCPECGQPLTRISKQQNQSNSPDTA